MGWLRKFLKGSASNSGIQSNYNEDRDRDEPHEFLDEGLDSEREETHHATTLSSADENEAEEDQRSDDGQSETDDEQYYKASYLVNEDEQLAKTLPQSLVFNSNPLWEVKNIFPHFPFSFYSVDRQRSSRSCEDDERCSCSDEPSDTEKESTKGEEEETDYQIASIRSVLEEGRANDLYGAASTEDWLPYEELKLEHEDEQPVQSFQQNLAFESSSLFDIAKIFQPFLFSFYPDNRQAFRHPEFVHSSGSNGRLTDHEVFDSEDDSIYQNIDKGHYLNRHHHHHHQPRPICFVCRQPIPVDANGRLRFRQHPFWRQKYCSSHERDGTPYCCGCKRLKPAGSTYSTLSDGRRLCPECHDSAIMDDRAFKALEREIRGFYECLGMKVHQRTIPLYLVNEQEMKEARDKKKGHHQPNRTYGRTQSDVQPICTTVESVRHTLVTHSRVVAIRVLDGLPRLFTGKILTHEMMHAWLRLEGYHHPDREVREGLCEVLAHMWLDSQLRSMSKSKTAPSPQFDFQKRLAKFLQHDMETRTSSPYGTGFRLVQRAADSYGLKGALDYLRMTGSFPR